MPRPVAAFLVLSFINSHVMSWLPAGKYVGAGLVLVVAVLNLVSLPFMNHHGRKLQTYVKAFVIGSFALCIALSIVAPDYFWDALFVIIFGYSWLSWIPLSKEEKRTFFEAAGKWKAALNEKPS